MSFNFQCYVILQESVPHLDRGYAVTVHKSQGQTSKYVVLVTDSKNPLNKTETLYVSLSRAENDFNMYTDNPEVVKSQFKEAQPKTSTVDIFAEKGLKDITISNSIQR